MKISRRRSVLGGILVAAFFSSTLANAVSPASAESTEATYIIQVPETQTDALLGQLQEIGASPDVVYDDAINGVAVDLSPDELGEIRSSISGELIEADRPIELMGVQSSAPWNLSMLDYSGRPVDTQYAYPDASGAGARVYVIDTGIAPNPELGNRLVAGKSFISDGRGTSDCHGHGSHVAGTVASSTFGVAKQASVVPVRVFDCAGSGGYTSTIVAAINWAIGDKPAGTVGVINLSLGTVCRAGLPCSPSDALLTAAQNAMNAGFVVVVAAGNSGTDACRFSPAAAPNALTVGAIDRNDSEASFSNFGSCVDLYAPGVDIVSLGLANGSSAVKSGTSMATPHVAGAAALYISQNPGSSASEVTLALKANAAPNSVVSYPAHFGSTRAALRVSSSSDLGFSGIPPMAPTGLTATAWGLTSVSLSWQQSLSSSRVTDYRVSYQLKGTTSWITPARVASPERSFTVDGLLPGKSYAFRVQGVTDVVGPASSVLGAATLSGIPSQVNGVVAAASRATSVMLTWNPASISGTTVSDYEIQYKPASRSTWTTLNDGVSAGLSVTVPNLAPSTAHDFRARAKSSYGTGAWSSSLRTSTLSGIPNVVSGLKTSAVSPTSVSLAWTAPSGNGSDVLDYVIEFKRSSSSIWTLFADGTSSATNSTVTGLTSGATYNFRVSAKTQISSGAASPALTATSLTGKPKAIEQMTVSAQSTSLSLSWNPAVENGAPVTDYLVDYRATTTSKWTRIADGVSAAPAATITDLKPGVTYYVRILPVSSFGSGNAATSSARTQP